MATGLEILIDIHRVANQLSVRDADGFSSRDYEREGNYSLKVIISEFGSWNQAKKHVGLETMQSTRRVSDADLLGDLRRVAKQLGTSRITVEQYSDKGRYGEATIRQRFGNWVTALQKSGLDTETPSPHYTYSEDALLDDIRHIAKSMKKDTVTQGDYRTNRGPKMASAQTIKARFDTWNKALKRAGLRPNSPGGYPRHTREEAARALVGVILRAGPRPTMAEYASNKPSEAPNASSVIRALSARGWDEAINRANEYMKTGSLPAGGPRTPRKPNEALKKEIWERAKGRCENPGCPSEYPTIPRGFFISIIKNLGGMAAKRFSKTCNCCVDLVIWPKEANRSRVCSSTRRWESLTARRVSLAAIDAVAMVRAASDAAASARGRR